MHAQRGNFGTVDLIPALRAHKRLCEVELRSEAREHPTVLGANVVPRDLDVAVEHDLANFLVGPQNLAMLPPLRRGILRAKRDPWSAALFERSFQLEQVTAELIRKERPHLRDIDLQRQHQIDVNIFDIRGDPRVCCQGTRPASAPL
jgi:hypothetical protein